MTMPLCWRQDRQYITTVFGDSRFSKTLNGAELSETLGPALDYQCQLVIGGDDIRRHALVFTTLGTSVAKGIKQ